MTDCDPCRQQRRVGNVSAINLELSVLFAGCVIVFRDQFAQYFSSGEIYPGRLLPFLVYNSSALCLSYV